jgi:hypothetical protein
MEKSGENLGSDGKAYYPGCILFKRINAVRAAKNEKVFQIFMDDLSTKIKQRCQILRKGDMAELDAGDTSDRIHRHASSMGIISSNPFSEESVSRSTIPSTPNISPPSVSWREELPLSTYTSVLQQYVRKSGKRLEFISRQDCNSWLWYCETIVDGVRGKGEGVTKKDAKHMASRYICHALKIGSG